MTEQAQTYTGGAAIHTYPNFPESKIYFELKGATVQSRFHDFIKRNADLPAVAYREIHDDGTFGDYRSFSFTELATMVKNFGSGLRTIGLNPGDKVGILARNCIEWSVTDFACGLNGLVSVPVYDAYRPEECEYIIVHSEMRAIVITPDLLPFVVSRKAEGKLPHLEFIIGINNHATSSMSFTGSTHTFQQVSELGAKSPIDETPAEPDSLYTIVYTSGTTGSPKGAMITHNNICAGCVELLTRLPPGLDKEGRLYSYLPLAHIFERTLEILFFDVGVCVGYSSGDIRRLTSDIQAFRPTILPGVPRVFNKTYDKVSATINSMNWFKRWMFHRAYESKKRMPYKERLARQTWADKLVFKKVRETMGGCIRVIYAGAAALHPTVCEFLSIVFGVPVVEGYGLTETTAAVSCTHFTGLDLSNAGVAYPYTELRLESIPEMEYTTDDKPNPRGEILLRGPQLFHGYYKDEQATRNAFTADGFFRTGDIGAWMPGPYLGEASLRVIDRRRNIFKLAHGEFVSCERAESAYIHGNPFLASIMLSASTTRTFLLAFVCPVWEELLSTAYETQTHASAWPGVAEWRAQHANTVAPSAAPSAPSDSSTSTSSQSSESTEAESSASSESSQPAKPPTTDFTISLELRKALSQCVDVRNFLLHYLQSHVQPAVQSHFIQKYEVISGLVICPEEWSPDNGLMTPSFKVKRDKVRQFYAHDTSIEEARVEKELKLSGATAQNLTVATSSSSSSTSASSSSTSTQ